MWRPWGDDESMELVDINVIDEEIINLNDDGESNRVDRNELEEEGKQAFILQLNLCFNIIIKLLRRIKFKFKFKYTDKKIFV